MTEEQVESTEERTPKRAGKPGDIGAWLFGGWIGTLAVLLILFAWVLGKDEGKRQAKESAAKQLTAKPAPAKTTPATPAAPAGPGKQIFATTCGGCHTLTAAGTNGAVGPNLDELKPDAAMVEAAIVNGGAGSGAMPKGLLKGTDAQQVADFIAKASGG